MSSVAFGHLSLDARLLLGCHDLPLPGPSQVLHSLLNGICLRDKQIGAFSELDKAGEGPVSLVKTTTRLGVSKR